MDNKILYHIFQKRQGRLLHIFPNHGEHCDERDVAFSVFDSIRARGSPFLLVEFEKDKKTHEVSCTIVDKNFIFKDDENIYLNDNLRTICTEHVSKLFF